jgi:hypothetical protein
MLAAIFVFKIWLCPNQNLQRRKNIMKRKLFNLLVLVSLIFGVVMSAQPAMALSLPEGTTITSATLYLYVQRPNANTVNIHRVTEDWSELDVTWNSFGAAYDPAVAISFALPAVQAPVSVDVTALVQGWVNGDFPNYGMLLEQGGADYAVFRSSEYVGVDTRPALNVCFDGSCYLIRRGVEGTVADTWISENSPDTNYGSEIPLYTGLVNGKEKQSLLRFDFELLPPPPEGEGCTPGFWRQDQHFDSWVGYSPADAYDLTFGVDGSFATLLDAVWAEGGFENALARHAVAALLNAASPEVDYAYSVAEVIAMVQAAYASGEFEDTKDLFEYQNELGCPLD